MQGQVRYNDSLSVDKPLAQVLEQLRDTRCLRAVLPSERLSDPRHYGPSEGIGARLAVAIEHVGIKRSGTLTLIHAPEPNDGSQVRWHGELPPVDYSLVFTATSSGPASTELELVVDAVPQPLFFYRFRTRRAVRQNLATEVPEVFDGLLARIKAYIEALPEDPRFRPTVSIDGFVEGCPRGDVPENGALTVGFLERRVAVFDVDGALFALADTCPHGDGQLTSGEVNNFAVTCPIHGVAFDLRSGHAIGGEGTVPTYPIREEDGKIWVRIQLV